MTSLNDETGTFLLSLYGSQYALGFKGEQDFIERCYNWAYNCGATSGSLHHFYEKSGNFAYVLVKDQATLLKALMMQFAIEIKFTKEVPLLKDGWDDNTEEPVIEYDEERTDSLARQRSEIFMRERIFLDNFQYRNTTSCAPIYAVGPRHNDSAGD